MKLTPRQRAFLEALRDLYEKKRQPIHYSAIAERLGVNKFSAYDMLRMLERKGFAASEYILAAGKRGPGRTMIVFRPTLKAPQLAKEKEEWLQVRDRMLERLREATDYRELMKELLAKIPQCKSPLIYCMEMITALLLNLNAIREKAGEMNPFKTLLALGPSGELGLGTLAGLSLGSSLAGKVDPPIAEKLLSYMKEYQAHLRELSEEGKKNLSDFLQEALAIFAT